MTWLERHKEIIINGLDLLSFLLVTSEVLRVIRPAVGHITTWIVVAVVAIPTTSAVMIGAAFGVAAIFDYRWGTFIPTMLMFIIFGLVLGFPLWILTKVKNVNTDAYLERLSAGASKNAAEIGVFLFLGTRVLALILSIHAL